MSVIIVLVCCVPLPSLADVSFKPAGGLGYVINIFGTINKADVVQVAQREAEFDHRANVLTVYLDSSGGDIDAAMEIGRIIRRNNGYVIVSDGAKCYSSCSLIYIAGVSRGVSVSGEDIGGFPETGQCYGFFANSRFRRKSGQILPTMKYFA